MRFEGHESYFVVFPAERSTKERATRADKNNFPSLEFVLVLEGPWDASFDPEWGGPAQITFDTLKDWTEREERGIKYYSGIATYRKTFDLPADLMNRSEFYIDLGTVFDLARVTINGEDRGVLWTAPRRKKITDCLRAGENLLVIEVVNRWPNRLIGDQHPPDADARTVKMPAGLLGCREFKTGRYTFAVRHPFTSESRLLPSGLIGPVRILADPTGD